MHLTAAFGGTRSAEFPISKHDAIQKSLSFHLPTHMQVLRMLSSVSRSFSSTKARHQLDLTMQPAGPLIQIQKEELVA